MSAIEAKRIAIVGGGPGGLTLARLLQQNDAQISVYERDPSRGARVQGSALDLHENSGLLALETAGLIAIEKGYAGKRARTWVTLTKAGQAALEDEIAQLKLLISRIEPAGTSPS